MPASHAIDRPGPVRRTVAAALFTFTSERFTGRVGEPTAIERETDVDIGERLRAIRHLRRLTLRDMADRAGVSSGAGTRTLPLFVFSSLRFGVSLIVNATATMMLARRDRARLRPPHRSRAP